MKQHPLSAAYPAMSDADIGILATDIEAHGQHELIVTFEGQILDGWHRFLACKMVKIKPEFIKLPDTLDPLDFVRSKNAMRRHLTGSQRAASEVALRDWASGGRPVNRLPGSQLEPKPATNTAMAKAAHVSVSTIKDAKAATKAGLGRDVIDGKITAKEAAGRKSQPAKEAHEDADYDPAEDALKEAHATIQQLAEENESLKDGVSTAGIPDAFATIVELRKQVRLLEVENASLKISRDGYQKEVAQLKKQCDIQRREIAKLKK